MSPTARSLTIGNVAARTLGFLPAVLGPRALYWTIASVETFVEEHYQEQVAAFACPRHLVRKSCYDPSINAHPVLLQIQRLRQEHPRELGALLKLLEALCEDEVEHRKEAVMELFGEADAWQAQAENMGPVVKGWCFVVDAGSRAAVAASKMV